MKNVSGSEESYERGLGLGFDAFLYFFAALAAAAAAEGVPLAAEEGAEAVSRDRKSALKRMGCQEVACR